MMHRYAPHSMAKPSSNPRRADWMPLLLFVALVAVPTTVIAAPDALQHPNVVFIICDDLNDYVEGFDGHPQAVTPNIATLAASGVRFTQAHCNVPICGPSRASLFTGIYPHHSGCYGFTEWYRYPVLKNSRTLMDHFRANGYHTLGTGKIMHHRLVKSEWAEYGNEADYGPFAYDGENNQPHPDTPSPYRNIGAVDGSFGPLVSLKGRTSPEGKPLSWRIGGWNKPTELKVRSPSDHDRTPDEKNGDWAVKRLTELAADQNGKPFFMAVGFIRPHTPLIVPQRFFDMFPVDQIDLPAILDGDIDDTFARTIRGLPDGAEPDSSRTEDMGTRLFRELVRSYTTREEALRHFIQAYLASVASVDEQIGRVIDAVATTGLADSTIIVLTSDHGWGMGEKDYLYKNSLWQEATRVPLIVRAPRTADAGTECSRAVSLIDLYPTLVELCSLEGDTKKNDSGHALDGHSLRPLLEDPQNGNWSGPDEVLTALYKWRTTHDPASESYALRNDSWRYIRYENGKEELYDTTTDPLEWKNLAGNPHNEAQLLAFRRKLDARLPTPGSVPPQPNWQPKQKTAAAKKAAPNDEKDLSANAWKDRYFQKHPEADTDQDGSLSWPEYKAHKAKAL
jgi:arylsulfatase A-like enzyme